MILFASDIHLSAAAPEVVHRFVRFLRGPARDAEALYLLGDLFEYWLGDDALSGDHADPLAVTIAAELRALTDSGVTTGFLPGNRDFLIGDGFYTASGVTHLADPYVLSVPTWQFVLTHGDQLCTDDHDYQRFRAEVRGAAWQAAFLARPWAERRQIAEGLRARSQAIKAGHWAAAPDIMDVNAGAVEDFLRDHGYATLIHGHTHRPDRHDHVVDGICCERWVLGDWQADGGDCLAWDGDRITRRQT